MLTNDIVSFEQLGPGVFNMRRFRYLVHAQNSIRAIAHHSYILKYIMILLGDSEDPEPFCTNGEADLGFRCPSILEDTFLHGTAQLCSCINMDIYIYQFCPILYEP